MIHVLRARISSGNTSFPESLWTWKEILLAIPSNGYRALRAMKVISWKVEICF
jgi:hypothetical protein